jgi:hypothetical protein
MIDRDATPPRSLLQPHDIADNAIKFNGEQPPVLPMLLLQVDAKENAPVRR